MPPAATWAGRRNRRLVDLVVALVAAAPTLVAAARSPGFIVDDWAFLQDVRRSGVAAAFVHGSFRPGYAAISSASFGLLGAHPVAHLLLMAAANALAAVLGWRLARRLLPLPTAAAATAIWLALPNRDATRLWITGTPLVLSLALTFAAGLLATGRPTKATGAACVAVGLVAGLTYEGSLGLVGLAIALCAWRRRSGPLMVGAAAVVGPAAVYLAGRSPKLAGAFHSPSRPAATRALLAQALGAGLGPRPVATAALVVAALSVGLLLGSRLPAFRHVTAGREAALGLVLLVAGAAPFAVTGFIGSTDGLFTRSAAFSGPGTAVVLAAGLVGAAHLLPGTAAKATATGLVGLAVVALAAGQPADVRHYEQAAADGRALIAAFRSSPLTRDGSVGPVVIEPLPNRGGVAGLVEGYDTAAALAISLPTPELGLLPVRIRYVTDPRPDELHLRLVDGVLLPA